MEPDPLETLRQSPQPPPELQRKVVAAVRAAGGFGGRTPGRSWILHLAAALVIFASGIGVGRTSIGRPAATPAAASFLLLLAGDVTPAADRSSRAAEYGDWARQVAAGGVGVRGSELEEGGRVVTRRRANEPMAALLAAGGYFVVDVETEAEAVALAESSPHVKYGGSVVVRRLVIH
jgi:hypothetical protein